MLRTKVEHTAICHPHLRLLLYLKNLPKSKGAAGATIDDFETWVSSRLRVLASDL